MKLNETLRLKYIIFKGLTWTLLLKHFVFRLPVDQSRPGPSLSFCASSLSSNSQKRPGNSSPWFHDFFYTHFRANFLVDASD